MYPYVEYSLTSHASLSGPVGRGSGTYVHSPLFTGNGVRGSGLVLTGVRGGRRDVGSRVRLMLVSLGRRLYAPGARMLGSSSDSRPRRRDMGGAKGVMGDMRRGFSVLPWKGPVVLRAGMVAERLLPLREWAMLPFRDWARWLAWPEVRERVSMVRLLPPARE